MVLDRWSDGIRRRYQTHESQAHMSPKHFDHDDMVANILHYRRAATPEQVVAGRGWYQLAGEVVAMIAKRTGIDPMRVAYALSALSPRNPWRWNVADAYAFASAKAEGRTMPSATTFRRNWQSAWRALGHTSAPWATRAPKVNEFVTCILGAEDAVVVDSWAVKVATGGAAKSVSNSMYDAVAAAYIEAAAITGDKPRDIQAITWLVAQTEGLASHRRSRPDLSFKAGTPDFIKEALA